MNVLFISKNLIAGNLAYLLQKEGHNVKMYVKDRNGRKNFDHIVPKTENWKKELKWVGKDGLIVFDDVGYGKEQDMLRIKGYTVFGGSEFGDKLEQDREYGQEIFKKYGIKTYPLKDFENMEDAVIFVQQNKKPWVIKQNDHHFKSFNYVGYFDDGRDVISVLKNYLQNKYIKREKITLHQRIDGVEIGIGRYFNGTDWVGPIEYNIEHTKFFPGDVGPITSEMGTLAWYDTDENNKLYKETLAKLEPFLREINFRGDFELNCIVNQKGAFVLEATARLGSPIVHLHSELHSSPWGEFLHAIASGKKYDLKWKKGYGIVVLASVPPFPFTHHINENASYGINIYFDGIPKEQFEHIHFEEISKRVNGEEQFYISDMQGYILYVTGIGETVAKAQEKVYGLIKKIIIPKMFYRNDIGTKFETSDREKLKEWGYL